MPARRRRALVAVNMLTALTGSELLALELAEALASRGWSTTLMAADLDMVFARGASRREIAFARRLDQIDLSDLDFLYVQHQMGGIVVPALAALAREGGLRRWPLIVFMHLSINADMETPGPFAEELVADESWCNSAETRAGLAGRVGPWIERAALFRNPAPAGFSRASELPDGLLRPRRVLAVSNHDVGEVSAAIDLLEARGISVTRVGGPAPRRVTPSLVAAHDAVLAIGKTVQYALRARRPVFCYGHMGGPGWLGPESFESAGERNFSGRSHPARLTAEQITAQVSGGFEAAAAFARSLPEPALAPFRLEVALDGEAGLAGRVAAIQSDPPARLAAMRERLFDPVLAGRLRHEAEIAGWQLALFLHHRRTVAPPGPAPGETAP